MALFISLILGFFAVRGFRYTVTAEGLVMGNTESFLWLLPAVFFVYVIFRSIREKKRQLIGFSAIFGLIPAVFYILGISMEKMHGISWMWTNRGYAANCLNLFYSHAVLYYCFAYLAFGFLSSRSGKESFSPSGSFSMKRACLLWGLLVLIYLPWFLSNYPAIISEDTADQISDAAITVENIGDHHSAFLTLMMRLVILPIRHFTGSLQTGAAVCSFLQMLIMTFVFALTCETVRKYVKNTVLCTLIYIWYAFYPINNLYSVTLWKDILFSVSFLALLLCVSSAAEDEASFFSSRKKMFFLMMTLLLLPLMRHNGLSVTVIMAIALLIRFKPWKKQLAVIFCCVLVCFGSFKYILLPALNVTPVKTGEALSIFQQQMARAMNVHHDELTEAEMEEFTEYFDITDLWTRYHSHISDSVKRHFLSDRFAEDPAGFFRGWIKLGRRYPVDYIEAFLANNYGYWFPETRYWIFNRGVTEWEELGDLHYAPIIRSALLDRICDYIENEEYAKSPLLPLLFSRGACFWLWLFCGIYCLYNNRRRFILFIPGLSLWLGVLISPVYNEYRYVYGLFAGLPLLLAVTLSAAGQKNHFPDTGASLSGNGMEKKPV